MLKEIIQGDEFSVIVVTPAIISNYFLLCKEARLSEFTLFIFDEYHHATGRHPYNDLIMCVLRACKNLKPGELLPQVKLNVNALPVNKIVLYYNTGTTSSS